MWRHLRVGVVWLAAASATSAESVSDLAVAYSSPTLIGSGVAADGQTLTCGHLTLTFDEGTLHTVVAGDHATGLYFHGRGSFRYVSADPFEAANWRHNVGEETEYEVDAAGAIGDTIEDVLIISSGPIEPLSGDEGARPTREVAEAFASHLARWSNDYGPRYPQLMPQARIESPASPCLCVEIGAVEHDLLYTHDPLREGDETVAIMVEVDPDFFEEFRHPETISVQPLGRLRSDPRAVRFVLVDLDVNLLNETDRRAVVTVRETIEARAPVRTLDFSLANWFAGTVGMTASWKELTYRLREVRDGSGTSLRHAHGNHDLVVELAHALEPGESIDLVFELEGDVLYRPDNDNYWWLDWGWYPAPSRRAMAAFKYHAVVKVPRPWTAFSDGAVTRRWEEGSLNCAEFDQGFPMDYAVILAGKYHTFTDAREGLVVRVSNYARENERASRKIGELVHGFIGFYEQVLGDYPWTEVNVIEVHALGFGQAPPGIIFITREAFAPAQDSYTQLFSQGINERLAHEVAHAWWGNVALLADREDQWLSESMADYYAAVALANLGRKKDWNRALRDWKRMAKDVGDKGSVYMGNYVKGTGFQPHRYALLYGKGPLVLHAMRLRIQNDDLFFTILKSYLTSFRGKPAYTRDFVGITNYITKEDWTPWFDRYLFGTEIPEID